METTEQILAAVRHIIVVLALLLVCGGTVARAEQIVGGSITTPTTWRAVDSPFLATADVVVDAGATLNVEAGAVVRFQSGIRLRVVNGALRVSGTAAVPVLFTSWKDAPAGTPAAGDWGGLEFSDFTRDADTIMEYLTVRYGATTTLVAASPTFNHCTFENNSGYALATDLASYPHGVGNSALNNTVNAIKVPAGEMTSSGSWDLTGIPYFLEGELSIGLAPRISAISPIDMEQGSTVAAVISGTRLAGAKSVIFTDPGVTAVVKPGGTDTALPVDITISQSTSFGAVGYSAQVSAGVSVAPSGINIVPPVPRITTLTPDRLYVSQPPTTIDITGANFISSSQVFLDGVGLVTTYVSETLVRGTIPTQLISGSKSVQVKNPDPRYSGSFIVSPVKPFLVDIPSLVLSPATLGVRQKETGNLTASIPFAAPVGGVTITMASASPAALTVPATVTIPAGEVSAVVTVAAPDTLLNRETTVLVSASQNNWLGASATVTVRPEPTVNLTPTTVLYGQGSSFFLTVSLTDPAPVGGLVVNLSATPATVVSVPASVTIPAGATQVQVTIMNTGAGSATITATPATGSGYSVGDGCTVTVKPVQTYTIGPMLSAPVGVRVGTPTPPVTPPIPITSLVSRPVGISMGAMVTGLEPDRAVLGTQNLVVRIKGFGLAGVTDSIIQPDTGITIKPNSLTVAPDGSFVEVTIDIASDAPVAPRVVSLKTNSGTVPSASPSANRFQVTYPQPQLWSLLPNNGVIGSTFTLQVNGRNLFNASSITFEPPEGITVGSSISVSSDGAVVSVPIAIDVAAVSGKRVVRITTPGGISTAVMNVGNAFTVTPVAGALYTPVVSTQVGVMVPVTTSTQVSSTYSPIISPPLGIAVGPVMTGMTPSSGAIGAVDLRVRLTGNGLTDVNSLSFNPATGITITPGSLTVAADGSYVEAVIGIASDAPLTARTVLLKTPASVVPSGMAGVNIFRVTLPQPQLLGIAPIRREAGSTFTLSLSGLLLSGASQVSFIPPDGITVVNPPTVSSDGAVATVAVNIVANAPTTQRVVTITTPGGTTSENPSAANTFTVTSTAGATYSPILSSLVGVNVAVSPPATSRTVGYGPVVSRATGVFVPSPPPPTTTNRSYGPILSRPVGIIVGSAVSSITPTRLEPGATATVTMTGFGLDRVTSLTVAPATGITVGIPVPSSDGLSVAVQIAAAPNVSREPRVLLPMTASGPVYPSVAGSTVFFVGPRPSIVSISPILQTVGNTFTLTINGTNLGASSSVRFEPSDGILVANPPTINAAGTQATVAVVIDGMTAGGQRVVVVDGPYGASDNISGANNTFTISRPVVLVPTTTRLAKDTKTVPSAEINPGGRSTSGLLLFADLFMPGISAGRQIHVSTPSATPLPAPTSTTDISVRSFARSDDRAPLLMASMITHGYRGPPLPIVKHTF